ncbi:AAA domain-containing protein [Ornithinibacillus sp. L9]|uniref:AAA domain-containing protein n=1 Tax=Ornithinibacillus caprae TaxID=2678566 RepID=A0A6N8FIS7_9BACI|nr:sigma 54-interacting transcriptional regulator [Ornithinibacillus caprae]MUK88586.1 AAA domain-containing protein [Ornithinibacillus caprae]
MKMLSREWLEEIISLLNERIVVVNQEGIVMYMDKAYCDFINTTMEEVIGKPVQDVIENTRMHIVAKTGKEEIQDFQPINGSVMVASRFPIVIDGEIVGAVGTVNFPDPEDLRGFKNNIQQLVNDLSYYRSEVEKELKSKYTFDDLVGDSPSFKKIKEFAKVISGSDSSVLITGESGTGKELFANAIHNSSLRGHHPFVPINCASIPEELLESELFGYEDGAFTGAKKGGKKGLFEVAKNGTVFLDEIGDMPLSMQSKLLRALQEREIQPVGGQKTVPIDVRIIAATHQDIQKMVEEGTFRKDLYYRLNVIQLEIPSLRNRKEDIKILSEMLLKKLEKKFYRKGVMLSPEVLERFKQHSWPGNVRELENVLERAINVLDDHIIKWNDLPLYLRELKKEEENVHQQETHVKRDEINLSLLPIQPLKDTVAMVEKQTIINTLEFTRGSKLKAAQLLGIGKTSFYDKCKAYGIK